LELSLKITILTSFDPSKIYLVNYLAARKNVTGVVIENPQTTTSFGERIQAGRAYIRQYGFLPTINRFLYQGFRRYFLVKKYSLTIKHLLFPEGEGVWFREDIPTIRVANVNDTLCEDFLMKQDPDVIIVFGTRLLKSQVFGMARKGTINLHLGITPWYRGENSLFWALYNGEPEKVGVTVHFVDEDLDTGPIIYQERVAFRKGDDLPSLWARCIRVGVRLINQGLIDIQEGAVKIQEVADRKGYRAYRSVDLGMWQYLKFRKRLRKLRESLPAV
jgi:methionyl-tRNA formyltransferase